MTESLTASERLDMGQQLDHVDFRGELVTRRQRAAFLSTEDELAGRFPKRDTTFANLQGSWQPYFAGSFTTHLKAGVADLWLPDMGDNDFTLEVTRILRRVGCQAAFLRGPGKYGDFGWHWHCCDLDTREMDGYAADQVQHYRNGGDGLGSFTNPDPVPYRPDPIREFDYAAWSDAAKLRNRIALLDDRIDTKVDTLESLRDEKAQMRHKLQRVLNH